MFSGTGFFTKEGKPAIIYHGEGSGHNQISIAQDDELEKWSFPTAVEPIVGPDQDGSLIANWDPDAWLDGNQYYALSGGSPGSGKPPTLFRSEDLKAWKYLGLFLTHDMPDVKPDEDISCPNFFKIGNKDMLLCISHTLGCRYYLGEWKNEKFSPEFHARMNWHQWDFFAPESVQTADGRRVMWAWCNLGQPQSGIQSLPRELSLPEDGILRIKPLRELESLRGEEFKTPRLAVENETKVLNQIHGDALEIVADFRAPEAKEFGVKVHCNATGQNGAVICIKRNEKILQIGEVQAPFECRENEDIQLRVFVDKNVIEAFVNDRQAAVISHAYEPQDTGVSVIADGKANVNVKAWKIESIYE
jgi:sucrose-6-phosphate hydrolase SacC (GH32 family)